MCFSGSYPHLLRVEQWAARDYNTKRDRLWSLHGGAVYRRFLRDKVECTPSSPRAQEGAPNVNMESSSTPLRAILSELRAPQREFLLTREMHAEMLRMITGNAVYLPGRYGIGPWTRDLWALALSRGLSLDTGRAPLLPFRPSRRFGYRREEIERAWGGWALGVASSANLRSSYNYSTQRPRSLARSGQTSDANAVRARVVFSAVTETLVWAALARLATSSDAQVDFSLLTRGMWHHALARRAFVHAALESAAAVHTRPAGSLGVWSLVRGLATSPTVAGLVVATP